MRSIDQSIRFYSALFGAAPSVKIDPQGVAWESFHTLDSVPVFGTDTRSRAAEEQAKAACCVR